ncbi:exodeoxyribonuclease VII large subunit [Ilumatobacter nonamiensis]|uniref:exodeoxyribonuclease VII large subunit n=1 Tax=Ilumatobacter nonamiensis TaxID=467093 RepID=UPI0006850397|nr:exodeoxyribonuclease VII large subunit [Ilumatobacter nonamiensis]
MSQPAFDFDDAPVDEPGDITFSVGELADAIDDQLRRGFRDGVWVRGEINGLKRGGPHIYFSLVEKERGSEAKIEVKLFAPAIARLTPKLRSNRLDLRDGMKVRIHGFLDFYKPRGTLGLKMIDIDPRYTLGEIAQSRDEILSRLVASGMTGFNKRHQLSPIPLRIGVAASVESAGFADFHSELLGSGFAFDLVVADTRVQGDGADRMVAGAIGTLARGARKGVLDAIVVIRGGGAKNELAVFDSERIAHTIAMVPCPVFTGIGHEVDRTIADEVAHTALKTPTACAGALVEHVARYVDDAENTFEAIVRRSLATTDEADRTLTNVAHRIAGRTTAAIERANERLATRRDRLVATAPAALARSTVRLDAAGERLLDRATMTIERETNRLAVLEARIASVDPAVQLARGWTITRNPSGGIVRSTDDVAPGDTLTTHVIDGAITSVVDAVQPRPDSESDADA